VLGTDGLIFTPASGGGVSADEGNMLSAGTDAGAYLGISHTFPNRVISRPDGILVPAFPRGEVLQYAPVIDFTNTAPVADVAADGIVPSGWAPPGTLPVEDRQSFYVKLTGDADLMFDGGTTASPNIEFTVMLACDGGEYAVRWNPGGVSGPVESHAGLPTTTIPGKTLMVVLRMARTGQWSLVSVFATDDNTGESESLWPAAGGGVTNPVAGSVEGLTLWLGSQAAYDALTPDAKTIYYIV
jgi:hypothetical protein